MKRLNLLVTARPGRQVPAGRYGLIGVAIAGGLLLALLSLYQIMASQSRLESMRTQYQQLVIEKDEFETLQQEMVDAARARDVLTEKIAAVNAELEGLYMLLERRFQPLRWLAELEERLPASAWLTRVEGGHPELSVSQVLLTGHALDRQAVNELVEKIESMSEVERLIVKRVERIDHEDWVALQEFELACQLKPIRQRLLAAWQAGGQS